jgi:2-keto-3-deoxy-L-rhamnonate aldolase RhmA
MRLKERLKEPNGIVTFFGLGQFISPKWVELVGLHGGYDAVWLDHEHAGISTAQIEQAALAARAVGLDSFVRLYCTDYATIMRPLEAGAGGIMAAQVRSAQEVEQIVKCAKFYPRGCRGMGATGVDADYGALPAPTYLTRANAESFIAIQIEHYDAIHAIDEIAAVADVDLFFIGPFDLAQSYGLPGQVDHPQIMEAVERVARAAAWNQKPWGILPKDAAHARRCVELGCRCMLLGFDAWVLNAGMSAFSRRFEEFLPVK